MHAIPQTKLFFGATLILTLCLAMQAFAQQQPTPRPINDDATTEIANPAPQTKTSNDEIQLVPDIHSRKLVPSGHVRVWPRLQTVHLAWLAVIIILLLGFRTNPLGSCRNLDTILLALASILLLLRYDVGTPPDWALDHTFQWWSTVLLSVIVGYFLLRGIYLLRSRSIPRLDANLQGGALAVIVVIGLVVGIQQVVTAPLSDSSIDAVIGAAYTAETGNLPYGDTIQHDHQSPLLYLLHAGTIQLLPVGIEIEGTEAGIDLAWSNRDKWQGTNWQQTADLAATRLANGLIFILTLLGIYIIGTRLHSSAMGLSMVAIFCVFPGVVECLAHPDLMLPTLLLTWTLAFALLPGVGGLLATFTIILAGIAWPWAWLGFPIVLAYFLRQGLHALGAILGTAAGIAAIAAGLLYLAQPTVPRMHGALAVTGLQPEYTVDRRDANTLQIKPYVADEIPQPGATKWAWNYLLQLETVHLAASGDQPEFSTIITPDAANLAEIQFNQLNVRPDAMQEMNDRYRAALTNVKPLERIMLSARSVIEATWFPQRGRELIFPSTWRIWSDGEAFSGGLWVNIRRGAKLLTGVVSLLIALALLVGAPPRRPAQLVGGLLIMAALVLLTSRGGATTNLAWILPMILATWAVHYQGPPPVKKAATAPPIGPTTKPPSRTPERPTPEDKIPLAPGQPSNSTPAPSSSATSSPSATNPNASSVFSKGPAPRITVDE